MAATTKTKNALSLLLNSKMDVMELPKKSIEIPRLSQAFGEKMTFTIRALNNKEFKNIQDLAIKFDKKDTDIDTSLVQSMILIEGIVEPSLKDKELRDRFGVATPIDLLEKLLLPGEILHLYNQISELSGFGDDSIVQIKN